MELLIKLNESKKIYYNYIEILSMLVSGIKRLLNQYDKLGKRTLLSSYRENGFETNINFTRKQKSYKRALKKKLYNLNTIGYYNNNIKLKNFNNRKLNIEIY